MSKLGLNDSSVVLGVARDGLLTVLEHREKGNILQQKNLKNKRHRWWLFSLLTLLCVVSSGCARNQIHASVKFENIALTVDDLETHGLAFITPSTVTGREQDIQSLAFIFARVLEEDRPQIRVVSLPETLSAINQAGLADEYKHMYIDYSDTGIFNQTSLKKTGEVSGVRYLAQLKLSGFEQGAKGRFGMLGWRMVQTKQANIRLFLQVWDSGNGAIVWEGTEELSYAHDTFSERPVTFQLVVEEVARNLLDKLPQKNEGASH
ncbi:MAG: hypothetical protein KBT88_02800 [Gammaproteobacteria bacterium]|nr:hypothetical protein [Gammaproteobacteria bacterium]MBQ0838686.1 hypothetical protein [Gammaproteobacteria bacterium]